MIPDELVLEIYKYCDYTTRININRVMCWDYNVVNPYFDHVFNPKPIVTFTISRNGGFLWDTFVIVVNLPVVNPDVGFD